MGDPRVGLLAEVSRLYGESDRENPLPTIRALIAEAGISERAHVHDGFPSPGEFDSWDDRKTAEWALGQWRWLAEWWDDVPWPKRLAALELIVNASRTVLEKVDDV